MLYNDWCSHYHVFIQHVQTISAYSFQSSNWLKSSPSSSLFFLSFSLTPHIHLIILISVWFSFNSCSTFIGQVSLPCRHLQLITSWSGQPPRYAPPLYSPWAPKRLALPSRRQSSSSFPRPTRSHAHCCSRLLTWNWFLSHVWRGLLLRQFWSS